MDPQPIFDLAAKFAQDSLVLVLPSLVAAGLNWLKTEMKNRQVDTVLGQYAPMVVQAAEQLHLTDVIQDRKAYAIEQLQKVLNQRGVKVDVSVIDLAVEAAVMQEFNLGKPASPAESPQAT